MAERLGKNKKVAYLVPDIEAAMDHWSRVLGVGPWFYNPKVPIRNYHYRGERYRVSPWLRRAQSRIAVGCTAKTSRRTAAFSAGDAEPQQRVREQGRSLYAWLQDGAHVYVCGSIAMGREVHRALLDVLQAHAGLDAVNPYSAE